MKRRGLGKGLEALLKTENLSDNLSDNHPIEAKTIAIANLVPNPYQPRKTFDESAIAALADSISQHGVIQPLAVRLTGDNCYEIIAGERRFRAAQLAGLTEVPAIVHEVSDNDSAAFALIENLQREDLNVIEKAKGIRALIENFKLTHQGCAKVLGQSRSAISNTLRLLELSDEVQNAVANKSIDMGHARALLPLEKAEQHELLQRIQLNGLSVRETEALVKASKNQSTPAPARKTKPAAIKNWEVQLSECLKTKVNISQQASGNGKISLAFSDEQMLERIVKQLGLE